MPQHRVSQRRLHWLDASLAAETFEEMPLLSPSPSEADGSSNDSLEPPYHAAPPRLLRTGTLRPKPRPSSPPAQKPPPTSPPPLPPIPPWASPFVDAGAVPKMPGVQRVARLQVIEPLVPRRTVPQSALRPLPPRARPQPRVAPARIAQDRPDYGYRWARGTQRIVVDRRIAGACIFETVRRRDAAYLCRLIEQMPDVLIKADPEQARTPLGWAVLYQRLDVVRVLVSAMHAYAKDTQGEMDVAGLDFRTPLFLAIEGGSPDAIAILDTLLAAGVSIYVRTRQIANAWGTFFLFSSAGPADTQDAAEHAVRRNKPLALHQILKWDEHLAHMTPGRCAQIDVGVLATRVQATGDTAAQMYTVLRAARQRRKAQTTPSVDAELESHMARLGVPKLQCVGGTRLGDSAARSVRQLPSQKG